MTKQDMKEEGHEGNCPRCGAITWYFPAQHTQICDTCFVKFETVPNSLPSQQIERMRLFEEKYAGIMVELEHGKTEWLWTYSNFKKDFEQELEACMESARKEVLQDIEKSEELRNPAFISVRVYLQRLIADLSQPKGEDK